MKLKFCQTARLEVCYGIVSFFAKVKIFRFRPILKTMDYNPCFDFHSPKKVLRKACQLNVHLNGAQNGKRKRSVCQNKGATYNATNVDLGSHYRVLCAAQI